MIQLTDLRGNPTSVPGRMIREIREVPDTIVILDNGNSLFVRESVSHIIDMMTNQRVAVNA